MKTMIASKAFQVCLTKLAWKYYQTVHETVDMADLVQIGNEAALKAIADYDPTVTGKDGKVASPKSFLLSRARSAIQHAVRDAQTRTWRTYDLSAASYEAVDANDRLVEQLPAEESNMLSVIDVHTVFKRLTQTEVELLSKVYLEGYTQEELAEQDCHCRQAVNFQVSKILKKVSKKHAA